MFSYSTGVPNQDTARFSGEGLLSGAHVVTPGSGPDGRRLKAEGGLWTGL